MEQKDDSVEYGSLVVNNNRAIAIDELTEAFVTVTGYGMDELSQTVGISNGKGSFQFDKVPSGKNRIVTVKSNVDGIVMRNIVDVEPAKVNSVTVNWDSTALGNVFYYLNKDKVDITKVDAATIKSLSKVPGREGLISMFLSVLQAPIRQFAATVQAIADAK